MSQPIHRTVPPSKAADISEKWIATVGAILKRDGMAARRGRTALVIEVQFINLGVWQPLNLQTNTAFFATRADRQAVLNAIWRAQGITTRAQLKPGAIKADLVK